VNTFNPQSQTTNFVIGNDTSSRVGQAGFATMLTANTPYIFVTTGNNVASHGAFTLSITLTSGNVNPANAPFTLHFSTSGVPTFLRTAIAGYCELGGDMR
jgi:hypothetical protein